MLLSGWKDIAGYLDRGVRTVQRWESIGLPVRRPNARLRSAVIASTEELDAWVRATPRRNDIHEMRELNERLRTELGQLRDDNVRLREDLDRLREQSANLVRELERLRPQRRRSLTSFPSQSA